MLIGLNFIMAHVTNVAAAKAFYIEKLGFVVEDEQPDFVQFKQPTGSGAVFALSKATDVAPNNSVELWWFVDNADATYAELKDKGVETLGDPIDEPFGRTFGIKAPDGHTHYMLQLAQG